MNLLTIKEAARILKVSEKTLRRWEEKSYITPIRTTGKHRRYSLDQLKTAKKNKSQNKIDININEISSGLFRPAKVVIPNVNNISTKRTLPKSFVGFLIFALFTASGYTTFRIKSDTYRLPVVTKNSEEESVLAATSFQNAEFNINLPTIFSSSVTMNSSLTIGEDTFSDITGKGLTIVDGALTAIDTNKLGDDINSIEIVDGTISEVDLLSSNTPSGSQILSFNPTTGGFTWTNQVTDTDTVGTNYFTDSGDITYLTATGDDFAIGGTSSTAPFYIDSSTGTINLAKSAAGKWINFSDGTDEWGLYNRAGTPEGFITANTGTLAMDTANGTLYVKTDDSDATGWVNLATGVSSPWSETAGLVTLGTTTSNVNVGGSTDLAKLAVDGDTDEIQFLVQGNSTQTANLAVFENSSGVDLLSLSNSGGLTIGSNGTDGTLTLYSEQGTTDYSTVFQPGTQTENITYTLPVDNGAADNYVLTTDGSGILTWESVGGIGGMASFTLSGDSGTDQTISDTNTLEVAGGTNGIDTVGTATDTITLNLDTTEIGTTTFGSGSDIVWTFDAGATDPIITFASGSVSFGSSQFSIDTTNGNLTSAGDVAINGGDITSSGDLTITPTGADVFLSDGTVLNIGGNGTDVAYNVIGDTTSGASVNINSDDDLYIEGNLEVDGSLYAGGVDISTFVCPDCIDFDDMEDTLDLDAALILNQDTSTWTQNFTGTTTTGLTYNANSLTTGGALNVTSSSNPAGTGPVSPIQFNLTSTNATTATTFNAVDIGFTNNPSVAGNTEYILQIQNEVTSNTTDNAVTGLLRIDNADTSTAGSTVATNGLLITNSGDIAGGITNAINIDDTDITTDIVLQNDETIDNNVDGTIVLTAGLTSLSGDLTVTGGDITLNTAGTIIPSGAGTITIGNSSLQSLTVTTDSTGDAEIVLPTGSISGTEILDGTISEVDLNATNSPTSAYILSYDSGGGFTWISNTGGTGASKFTDSGTLTYLTDSTDSLTIGSSSELAKLAIDGDADEIQLLVQGNATQTAGLFTVENSSGSDFFVIEDLGGLAITPSSTDDVTITTDSDSTIVITGLASGSGTALCIDGTNNMVTCSTGSSSATLQSSYDADTNGSNTIIALTSSDDSIVINNPASSGTDSAFSFQINNLAAGVTTSDFKNIDISEAGTFDTTSGSLTNYATYIANSSTESAGGNTLTNVGLYVTSSGGDTNYSGIFEAGNFGIGDTSPASLFTVGATDAFQVNSSGNIVAIGTAAHSISNSSGNLVITPASSGNTTLGSTTTTAGTTIQSGTGDITFASQDDFIFSPIDGSEIDITAIASTTIEGVIDLNVDTSVTGGFEVENLGLTVNNGATAGDDFTSILTTLTANDADADLFGIQINSAATVNAGAGSYEALIRLDNAEDTIGAVTDSILITSSSATDADITDAIDVSHANIVNAINIGANVITGTTANIDLSNFDVTGSNGNVVTAGDVAINGGDITATGDLTITPAGGDLFLSDGTTLNIGGNATDVAYNIIGDNNTGASASMTSDDDLYIEGFLEADSGTILSPDSTNDISIVTDADSTLNVTGLSSGTGNALCLDGSSNVITCTVGSGGISGSGTAGQIAFFDSSNNIISEASGFGWDSTNNLFTITGGAGNTTQTAETISSTAQGLTSGGLLSATLTNTSATASFTGDILGVTSIRDNDTAQTLTDTGNLVEFGRTTTTNDAGATTNVSGAILNITNTVTATAGTVTDSANLIAVTQDADATGALLYLNTNRSSTGTAFLVEQSSGGTDILQLQDNGNLTILGVLAASDFSCTDCLDFAEFANSMSIDETTDINLGASALTIDLDSTGDFSIRDVTTDIATFADSGAITFAPTAGTAFLTNLGTGSNVQIATLANPTTDLASITNTSFGTTTNGVDGLSLTFVTGDGTDPTNNGINLALTSGGTAATDILNGINFGLTGTSGTERGINFADNNFDTDINATTDLTIGIDGTNEITLTGTNLAPTTAEGNSLGSATLEWEEVFVGDDAGIKFGLDQDWSMLYDQAGDSRLELTTAGTTGMLIQTANATGTSLNLTTNSLTTGTGFLVDNSANTLTTGTLIQAQSTGTSLTTAADAFLGYFDWTPGSATTASGDLFRINIGSNGNVTNVFNITDNGSSLFRVSETQIESAIPHLFSAAGDVNIAYDLVFTNQTASTIDSYGPLTLRAGESFESNNLTLTSYNSGNILLNVGATAGKVGVGTGITPLGLLTVDSTGTGAIGKAALTVIQDESQDIITASASATTRFTVNSAGNTFVTLRNTATSAVCHVTNGAGYDELTDCLTSVSADYAERYPVAEGIGYGEIVMTGTEDVQTTDGKTIKQLVKSNAPYQNNTIGVTSDNYGDFTSAGNNVNDSDNPMPVALSGRVPVKISNNSEAISSGDFITSSNEEGKAMKATSAGKVVGIALENWTPNSNKETAMVFVSNFYYTPVPENVVSREEIEDLLRITEQNQELLEESANWNTNTATSSAKFDEVITNDLFVTGIAALNSLSLSESLTLNNNLVIQDGNIDSISSPLNLQGSAAQALNFMAGKVTIDTNGNMVIAGDLKVLGTLDANKVSVSKAVAGTATITAGTNEVTMLNDNIKTGALIFVTPTSATKNSIYVKSQSEGQAVIGFDPTIVEDVEIPTATDINFNWWIVGITQ